MEVWKRGMGVFSGSCNSEQTYHTVEAHYCIPITACNINCYVVIVYGLHNPMQGDFTLAHTQRTMQTCNHQPSSISAIPYTQDASVIIRWLKERYLAVAGNRLRDLGTV